ncbi:uncharacterized protein B0I36DRAFT_409265 [Microdochium trichocladiopsis]|uniref:J domain-containing protein n=1 Tax=Microdochium trichocladiopsis TaxID=1682393 RepID=A0A9P9BQL8_9PEZI|nr:uncharacterized protein B0I36DRAFT_409265 [Microdochium trichocladiopsis]KAH7031023.1 hypothetical protein B0I36DRAFT_409265 [Microdochium trichocladiopsis]
MSPFSWDAPKVDVQSKPQFDAETSDNQPEQKGDETAPGPTSGYKPPAIEAAPSDGTASGSKSGDKPLAIEAAPSDGTASGSTSGDKPLAIEAAPSDAKNSGDQQMSGSHDTAKLQNAIQRGINLMVAESRLEFWGDTPRDPQSVKATCEKLKDDENIKATMIPGILDEYKKDDSTEDGVASAKSNLEESVKDIVDKTVSAIIQQFDKDWQRAVDPTSEQNQRKIRRVLKEHNHSATPWDVLGVKRSASPKEIKAARNRLALRLHPDKNTNNRSDANAALTAINQAYDILKDPEKTKMYLQFLKDQEPEEVPGEEFAPNAFDDGDDDDEDDVDSEDKMDESEESQPPPDASVKQQHETLTPHIKEFFLDLERVGAARALDQPLKLCNDAIRETNRSKSGIPPKSGIRPDAYTVDKMLLMTIRFEQQRIAKNFEVGLTSREDIARMVTNFGQYAEKVMTRPIHQWPTTWASLILDPLTTRLSELDKNLGQLVHQNACQELSAPTPLKLELVHEPGLTVKGYIILGYRPTLHWKQPSSSRFFVKVPKTGKMLMQSESEVGDRAALLYHQMENKNDITVHARREKGTMALEEIRDVCFGESNDKEKCPPTWIWLKEKDSEDNIILTYSDLCKQAGKNLTDQILDDFFVQNKIVPPWSPGAVAQKPAKQALVHARPTRNNKQLVLRQFGEVTPYKANQPASTQGLQAPNQPNAPFQMNDLLTALVGEMKEAREERKANRQQMMDIQQQMAETQKATNALVQLIMSKMENDWNPGGHLLADNDLWHECPTLLENWGSPLHCICSDDFGTTRRADTTGWATQGAKKTFLAEHMA